MISLLCQRTLLITKALDTLILEDSTFNYGTLDNYFQPTKIRCEPPKAAYDTSQLYRFGLGQNWHEHSRLYINRASIMPVDKWILENHMDLEAYLSAIDVPRDFYHPLRKHEGIDNSTRDAFEAMQSALKDIWSLNSAMERQIEQQKQQLGLSELRRQPVIGSAPRRIAFGIDENNVLQSTISGW